MKCDLLLSTSQAEYMISSRVYILAVKALLIWDIHMSRCRWCCWCWCNILLSPFHFTFSNNSLIYECCAFLMSISQSFAYLHYTKFIVRKHLYCHRFVSVVFFSLSNHSKNTSLYPMNLSRKKTNRQQRWREKKCGKSKRTSYHAKSFIEYILENFDEQCTILKALITFDVLRTKMGVQTIVKLS